MAENWKKLIVKYKEDKEICLCRNAYYEPYTSYNPVSNIRITQCDCEKALYETHEFIALKILKQ